MRLPASINEALIYLFVVFAFAIVIFIGITYWWPI
jgi:hypothetical protein